MESRPSGSPRDRRAIASLPDVVRAFRNLSGWYNNASFLLPLAATVLVGLAGAITRSEELLGFAGFLAAVTVLMVPVVLAAWRQTPTVVVVTDSQIVSIHNGRVLKSLPWPTVTSVRQRETQGNLRWEIASAGGDRMLLDGELEDLDELVALAQRLAGQRGSGDA